MGCQPQYNKSRVFSSVLTSSRSYFAKHKPLCIAGGVAAATLIPLTMWWMLKSHKTPLGIPYTILSKGYEKRLQATDPKVTVIIYCHVRGNKRRKPTLKYSDIKDYERNNNPGFFDFLHKMKLYETRRFIITKELAQQEDPIFGTTFAERLLKDIDFFIEESFTSASIDITLLPERSIPD